MAYHCNRGRQPGRRRGFAAMPARHNRKAQAAARIKRRPDQYRGEKLALLAFVLPCAALASVHLGIHAGRLGSKNDALRQASEKLRWAVSPPIQYPPPLALPRVSELALITPPLPSKLALKRAIRIAIKRPLLPLTLSLPERLLPPLPKLQAAALYPPPLALPHVSELALIIPPRPTQTRQRASNKARIATEADNSRAVCSATAQRSVRKQTAVSNHGYLIQTSLNPSASPTSRMPLPDSIDERAFGLRLVAAVTAQMGDMTYYNPGYIKLSYPMGDVPPVYGVCSDVIVRAYRRLGIDLQELVHRARVGSGDASIDQRRTSVLRKFFARYGDVLPITDYPEDYKPGDIVSYRRPFGRSSKSHIVIISNELAPSGRPYVLHNRAWGVQREDALFSDRITGHYRFWVLRHPLPGSRPGRRQTVAMMTAMPLPSRHKGSKGSRRKLRTAPRSTASAHRRRISLCSPRQPTALRQRIAGLCAATARKAMGLGMGGAHLQR